MCEGRKYLLDWKGRRINSGSLVWGTMKFVGIPELLKLTDYKQKSFVMVCLDMLYQLLLGTRVSDQINSNWKDQCT